MEGINTKNTEIILVVASVVVLLGASSICLAATATTDENESNAYILQPAEKEKLIAFVNEARDFFADQGKVRALKAFNDPKGKFVRGKLYIISDDFNGTRLAQPYMLKAIGQSALNETDINGVAVGRSLREVAKRGSGFSYYIWPNPAHSNAEELKLTYVLKVDDEWLAAGTYLNVTPPLFSNESREDLVSFVEGAKDFALNTTKEEAIKAFNDKNGKFVKGNRYIYAYDFAGNTLAHPAKPELIGKNRIDDKDPNGVEITRDMIAAAQNGNGFTYYLYPDPAKNMTQGFKLGYVTKVDDTWWLGSGIYAQ